MQLTQSQEDYLETIYVLKSQQDHVRAIDVAAALGFSKPSVSHALKDLKEKELIYTDKTGYIYFLRIKVRSRLVKCMKGIFILRINCFMRV